jgi:hypothetical protein
VIGGTLTFGFVVRGGFGGLEHGFWVYLAGLAMAVVGFAYLCVAVRCPDCGTKVFLYSLKNGDAAAWLGGSLRIGDGHPCKTRHRIEEHAG